MRWDFHTNKIRTGAFHFVIAKKEDAFRVSKKPNNILSPK